jgi:hypothetical protein
MKKEISYHSRFGWKALVFLLLARMLRYMIARVLCFKGINMKLKELFYASAKSLAFSYLDTTTAQALSFSINWLQVSMYFHRGIKLTHDT